MSLYKREGTEVWWSDLRHAGQRVRQSTGETDRAKAQKRENEFQVALWQHVPDIRGRTWGMAVAAWLDTEERSESELLSLAKFGRLYPDRALADVTRDSVHEALSFCKTAGTYTRYRSMIAAILNQAKLAGWLPSPPLLATKRDKKKKPRDWITREQWVVLHKELPPHLKAMATFAIETGLRQDNVLGLRWARVSIERRLVWVEAEDTKQDNAIAVPLSDAALAVLIAQRDAPRYCSAKGVEAKPSPFVFTFRGKRIYDVKTSFMAACVRAGLGTYETEGGGYEGFTWHGFRHTWATWHAQNGTPMVVLQKLGAWTDPRMVQNYAHHSPGHLASYANNNRKDL